MLKQGDQMFGGFTELCGLHTGIENRNNLIERLEKFFIQNGNEIAEQENLG